MTAAPREPQPSSGPRVLPTAVLGASMLWLAQPPVGCWPAAYAGVACWLTLAARPQPFGKRQYLRVWLGGLLYWLAALHWVCLPHPATPLGWPLLAGYLACYSLATVALVRFACRVWRAPLWIAGPVAWTGMEMLQARAFTGFLMGAVSHSHAGQPWVRSIAAYAGAYGVTFAVVLIGATLAPLARGGPRRPRAFVWPVIALLAVVAVGWLARRSVVLESPVERRPTVALVQGDTRVTWNPGPDRQKKIMDRQVALSADAFDRTKRLGKPLDLVVWPESMFRAPLYSFDGQLARPDGPRRGVADDYDLAIERTGEWLTRITEMLGATPLLAGIDRFDVASDPDSPSDSAGLYNSAVLTDGSGAVVAVYDKTHLVPFGEYIPFARGLPALSYLTPAVAGLRAGDGPVGMEVPLLGGGTLRVCPSICYETVIPRVVRRHVAELTVAGERPDALVNVTNDAWFWGASELDMHLACGVYRAIEAGTPLLVAANGGLSAVVDATGVIEALSERQTEQVLVAEVPRKTAEPTPYVLYGDLFAGVCLLACGLAGADALRRRWVSREAGDRADTPSAA